MKTGTICDSFISMLTDQLTTTHLASTGLSSFDTILDGDGYPDRSTILIVSPPGIAKDVLGY